MCAFICTFKNHDYNYDVLSNILNISLYLDIVKFYNEKEITQLFLYQGHIIIFQLIIIFHYITTIDLI
jgi:hypothetical protein